jgi:hypothetical protein
MAGGATTRALPAQGTETIDVKQLGAFGNGKLPDLHQVQQAIRIASERRAGATIFFPPGEYFLGAAAQQVLLSAKGLNGVRFLGERATLSCRSVEGQSSMLLLAGCKDVTVEGLSFKDYGHDRNIDWLGAAAINLASEGKSGCENIDIRNCNFDSVLAAVLSRQPDSGARCRRIALTGLNVKKSYYGLSFQNNCDNVVGRRLHFDDVKRSYFPYGVVNHDIELETVNNATGYTDVLIKCYSLETADIKVKVRCRAKRGGDAIVGLDQQHEKGQGSIRNIAIELDVNDVDCNLGTVIMMRSFDSKGRFEKQTGSRWDDISIDGDVRVCDKTKLIDIPTSGRTQGRLRIGPRLASHARLPASFPGFVLTRS